MILDIIKYGDAKSFKLRQKCINVQKENPFLKSLINDMFDTLIHSKTGVGLAAPQVGHNLNLFIIKTQNFEEVFINPEIQYYGLNIQIQESCLSVPNVQFPVNRREKVKLRYFDKNWVLRMCEFKDELAIIVQHEYDHLNGKLILD